MSSFGPPRPPPDLPSQPHTNPILSYDPNATNSNSTKKSTSATLNPSQADILECQIQSWYPRFKEHTIETVIIGPLESDFIDYLKADGIRLPIECEKQDDNDDGWNDDDSSGSSSSPPPAFPALTDEIKAAIKALQRSVLPKLNFSAPSDAVWCNMNTLKCTRPSDVYLLLKSSDFIQHDLEHVFDEEYPENYHHFLALRKWDSNMHKSGEFRCFVVESEIVAISQRKTAEYFAFLMKQEERERVISTICDWYDDVIVGIENVNEQDFAVSNRFGPSNFVLDVYVDESQGSVTLVDFNVFGSQTDSLLFSWQEIEALGKERNGSGDPELRTVEGDNTVRADPLAGYKAPIEAPTLAGNKGFEKFMKDCVAPSDL